MTKKSDSKTAPATPAPTSPPKPDAFPNQRAFAVSAATLRASHKIIDTIWDEYFADLPKHQPELRTVLIEIHRRALEERPFNIAAAVLWIQNRFDVADNTAKTWLDQMQAPPLSLVVRVPSVRRNERFLVPSETAKHALFRVGLEYAAVLEQLVSRLKAALRDTELPDVGEIGLISEMDYATTPQVD
jgi:hypothetical protein